MHVEQRLKVSIEIELRRLLLNVLTGDLGNVSKTIRKLEDSALNGTWVFGGV